MKPRIRISPLNGALALDIRYFRNGEGEQRGDNVSEIYPVWGRFWNLMVPLVPGLRSEREGWAVALIWWEKNHMKQLPVTASVAGGRIARIITAEGSAERWKGSNAPHLLTFCSAPRLSLWCNYRVTFLVFKGGRKNEKTCCRARKWE